MNDNNHGSPIKAETKNYSDESLPPLTVVLAIHSAYAEAQAQGLDPAMVFDAKYPPGFSISNISSPEGKDDVLFCRTKEMCAAIIATDSLSCLVTTTKDGRSVSPAKHGAFAFHLAPKTARNLLVELLRMEIENGSGGKTAAATHLLTIHPELREWVESLSIIPFRDNPEMN